jgi:DNA-binding NarL/FixJ family response regulator
MPTAAARAAARLRALGVRRIPRRQRATTCANIAGLTTRQVEVLALVAEGLTNAEIGTRLLISPKAVEQHVSAILGKLDVENRTDAAHWYRNHGVGGPAKSL